MLLARDGTCKLADVGLARKCGAAPRHGPMWMRLQGAGWCALLGLPKPPPAACPRMPTPPSLLLFFCSLKEKAYLTNAGTMGTFACEMQRGSGLAGCGSEGWHAPSRRRRRRLTHHD